MIIIDEGFLEAFVRLSVLGLELAGSVTIIAGALIASLGYMHRICTRGAYADAYRHYRANLSRSILLGLEFLVAADILKSVVINPSLQDLVVLSGLILIRTFLSLSLGVEINGHWPWQETRLARAEERLGATTTERTRGEVL